MPFTSPAQSALDQITGRPGRHSMDAAKQTAQAFAVTSALWLSLFALLSVPYTHLTLPTTP